MHLQVLRIKFMIQAFQVLHSLRHLTRLRDHIAAVNINRQLALLVHLFQSSVNPLMEIIALRDSGIKDSNHACIYRKFNPTL